MNFDSWAKDLADKIAKGPGADVEECSTCNGLGVIMSYTCYGGPPVEIADRCPDCDAGDDLLDCELADRLYGEG